MTFEFRRAVREQTSLLISIAGPSGAGKTYSALKIATGLAGADGRIAFIDTEAGRGLHYADQFRFDHGDMKAPFRPQSYTEAIMAADKAGYDVIVVDSMSHEYDGVGGILDWASSLADKMKPPKNWTEPKVAHKRMVANMLQSRAHLIFCLRAEDKIKITRDDKGKMVIIQPDEIPVQERWVPICEKRFMYEMTASVIVTPDRPGVPVPVKLQDQHRAAFPSGVPISEETGRVLAEWSHGGQPKPARDWKGWAREQSGRIADCQTIFDLQAIEDAIYADLVQLRQVSAKAADAIEERIAAKKAALPGDDDDTFPGDTPAEAEGVR